MEDDCVKTLHCDRKSLELLLLLHFTTNITDTRTVVNLYRPGVLYSREVTAAGKLPIELAISHL